jgi:hypothetical protein
MLALIRDSEVVVDVDACIAQRLHEQLHPVDVAFNYLKVCR